MDTTTLQTFNLRGMDERWIVDPQDALLIEDMFWTSNDSWRTSGGYIQVFEPDLPTVETENPAQPVAGDESYEATITTTGTSYSKITSLHWFAQHNGARQWLIFEEENYILEGSELVLDKTVTLKVFDGSKYKSSAYSGSTGLDTAAKPFKILRKYAGKYGETISNVLPKLDNRNASRLSIRTQSQSYGGRLYLVNGFDEAIVFDGDYCERAGFSKKPPAPTSNASAWDMSTTFPFAVGDATAAARKANSFGLHPVFTADIGVGSVERSGPSGRGFYTCHANIPYWGLGSTSDAEIGAGRYRYKIGGSFAQASPFHPEFDSNIGMRFNYYCMEQVDTRTCGYQYKVTYVNERGQESAASDASGISSIENGRGGKKRTRHGKGIISVTLPVGPTECVARRIYRTRNVYDSKGDLYSKSDQRSFYFLKEISDNMTTVFSDGHPDTALGSLLDTLDLGNFPPRTKFLSVFKNTMFAAGQELNEIRYSAPLFPESFPEDNILVVGDDDGGPITGMRATKNALIVFKTRGIYLVKGSPASGFVAQTLNKDVGCIAPDSIAELPGLGVVFLSEKSIYLLEGALENTGSITSVVNLGSEIPNQLERVNTAASIRACSAVYQKDKEYWLSLPIDGSIENNICFIYHYEVGSWSIRKNFPMECMVTTKDHRGYLFFGGNDRSDATRAGLHVYTRGAAGKGDHTIASKYETVSNNYQSVFTTFRPAYLMPYVVGYGNNPLEINYRVNRSIDQSRVSGQNSDQQDPNETYPVYGSAVYEKDRWTAYRPIVLRYDISATHSGPVREMSVSFAASSGNKIEIIGYDLEAKVGEQRNIKPLNKALRSSRR